VEVIIRIYDRKTHGSVFCRDTDCLEVIRRFFQPRESNTDVLLLSDTPTNAQMIFIT
jgi:hypothetical protein